MIPNNLEKLSKSQLQAARALFNSYTEGANDIFNIIVKHLTATHKNILNDYKEKLLAIDKLLFEKTDDIPPLDG